MIILETIGYFILHLFWYPRAYRVTLEISVLSFKRIYFREFFYIYIYVVYLPEIDTLVCIEGLCYQKLPGS